MINTIKFSHSDSGEIDFGNSKDCLSGLLTIGALLATRKRTFEDGNVVFEYATDREGLEALLSQSESACELILGMTQSISLLLTTANRSGFEKEHEDALWLISGLTGLAGALFNANSDLQYMVSRAELRAKKDPA